MVETLNEEYAGRIFLDEKEFPDDLEGRMSSVLNAVNTELKTVTLLHLDDRPADHIEIRDRIKDTRGVGYLPKAHLFGSYGNTLQDIALVAGITIPNINDNRNQKLSPGLYAIEPFATNGNGKIKDGNPSGIYELIDGRNPRSPLAREVLDFISEKYSSLPFCSRWLVKNLGSRSLLALKELESNGNLHQFSQLVEVSKGKVSQAENTILIDENGKVIVTTE